MIPQGDLRHLQRLCRTSLPKMQLPQERPGNDRIGVRCNRLFEQGCGILHVSRLAFEIGQARQGPHVPGSLLQRGPQSGSLLVVLCRGRLVMREYGVGEFGR